MEKWFDTFWLCPETLLCEGAAERIIDKAALNLNGVFRCSDKT